MKKQLLSLSTTLFLLLFSGCASGPYEARVERMTTGERASPILLLDHDLERTLVVDGPVLTHRNKQGLLTIQVSLRNSTSDESLNLQAQTLFRDAQGRALYTSVGSESAWQTLSLSPCQTVIYKQQALTKAATTFTVQIRYLQRETP